MTLSGKQRTARAAAWTTRPAAGDPGTSPRRSGSWCGRRGRGAHIAIDKLEPDAWRHESVRARAGELAQMRERALHGGIECLAHTEAQSEWLQGKAVSPVRELARKRDEAVHPKTSTWTASRMPPMSGKADRVRGIQTYAGQPFWGPTQGGPRWRLEFIRMLVSKENGGTSPSTNRALDVERGRRGRPGAGTAFNSAKGRRRTPRRQDPGAAKYGAWYQRAASEVTVQMGSARRQIDADGFIERSIRRGRDRQRQSIPNSTRSLTSADRDRSPVPDLHPASTRAGTETSMHTKYRLILPFVRAGLLMSACFVLWPYNIRRLCGAGPTGAA